MRNNRNLIFGTFLMTCLTLWSCSTATTTSIPNEVDVEQEGKFPEEVIRQLEDLYDDDQWLRNTDLYIDEWLNELRVLKGEDNPAFKLVAEKLKVVEEEVEQLDEKNAEQLEKIIDRYGWPDRRATSRMANKSAFLIVQHNFQIQEKYLPMMLESAKRGETPAHYVAYLQDRILMTNGESQLYGSQMLIINGKKYLWPIKDMEKVDERRKEMGLRSLEEEFGDEIPEVLPEDEKVTFTYK